MELSIPFSRLITTNFSSHIFINSFWKEMTKRNALFKIPNPKWPSAVFCNPPPESKCSVQANCTTMWTSPLMWEVFSALFFLEICLKHALNLSNPSTFLNLGCLMQKWCLLCVAYLWYFLMEASNSSQNSCFFLTKDPFLHHLSLPVLLTFSVPFLNTVYEQENAPKLRNKENTALRQGICRKRFESSNLLFIWCYPDSQRSVKSKKNEALMTICKCFT